jgi:hypothetical protein
MKTRKVHKRRRYRILTILAAFQPGGAHYRDHSRPMKTLVQEMNISITNTVRIIVLENLRYNPM